MKLEKVLGGIKDMDRVPGAMFVVDAKRERIAIQEAALLGIPSFVMVDTNSDPDNIPYIIPTNDDAIRSIRLFTSRIADAILEGAELFEKSARGEGPREETVRQVIPGKGIERTVEVVHKRETEEPEEEEKPAEEEEGADQEASPE